MANAAELTRQIDKVEERVANHIRFFWGAVALGIVWLGWLSTTVFNMNGRVGDLGRNQADNTSRVVAGLLSHPANTKSEAVENLSAASTILKTAKIGKIRPDAPVVNAVSDQLLAAQEKYADLPEVWQATSSFINYKYTALLLPSSTETETRAVGTPCKMQISSSIELSNCEATLEEFTGSFNNVTINGADASYTFVRCVIHYRGGQINGKRLVFLQCVFKFDVPIVPSSKGMVAMKQLTTADPNKPVEISS